MVVYYQQDSVIGQAPQVPVGDRLQARAMSNLLQPVGLVSKSLFARLPVVTEVPFGCDVAPCLLTGRVGPAPVFDPRGPMPDAIGTWISTERGARRLQNMELAKAKGLPSPWLRQEPKVEQLPAPVVGSTTSLHLLIAAGDSIIDWACPREESETKLEPQRDAHDEREPFVDSEAEDDTFQYDWEVPDLQPGGDWYNERVRSLMAAIQGRPDSERLLNEGVKALDVHRANYTEAGPQKLQLLWWEFPIEHQDAIRCGSSMNFLVLPTGELVLNSEFGEVEEEVACKFVDELISLGVLVEPTEDLKANGPLFVVDKAGTDDKRCISDMKRGGQNACIGKDPTYLHGSDDILPHLYYGGFSAVADASKHFHNFPTRPDERRYLGCLHPRTRVRYVWAGLPMGSSNSPAIACRVGNGVLRLLRSESSVFQGTPVENSWRTSLSGETSFDDRMGHGRVLIGADGLPAALIWAMVDDFFIHGPTKRKTWRAFRAFMDLTVRLGFICQKRKTKPPDHCQKYCGFIYDTTTIPTQRVPEDKSTRAISSIRYLQSGSVSERLARLTLAAVLGRLQSMVDATSQRIGQAYLRLLYDELHALEARAPNGRLLYNTVVTLSEQAWAHLAWWEQYLHCNPGRQCRAAFGGFLAATWGDGSGTGTGGTYEDQGATGPLPNMETWMGVWTSHVHHFSSNWRELRTLLRTLERLRGRPGLYRVTVFYFTDNLVTYYIVQGGSSSSPELHALIMAIKLLELELQVHLEVIHVPGLLMIKEGGDELSRGLWLSAARLRRSSLIESSQALAAAPFSHALVQWAVHCIGLPPWTPYHHIASLDPWLFHEIHGRLTVWTPTPEMARQSIASFLDVWVEDASTTSAIFLVPRIMQRDWRNISRHVLDLGETYPSRLPVLCQYPSDIPLVLLYIPRYQRALPRIGVDEPSFGAKLPAWIQHQVDVLRGL